MNLRLKNLNEGAFEKNSCESKNAIHCEGNNPKSFLSGKTEQRRQAAKTITHVNSVWEKLRK